MTTSSAAPPTCSCHSVRQPGRICWSERCSPNNCSAQRQSLRTTPIIAKVSAMRGAALTLLLSPLLAASALAQDAAQPLDATLRQAEAEQASAEAQTARLEQVAAAAKSQADRLHAQQAAAAQA